jgi:hypothetical protein
LLTRRKALAEITAAAPIRVATMNDCSGMQACQPRVSAKHILGLLNELAVRRSRKGGHRVSYNAEALLLVPSGVVVEHGKICEPATLTDGVSM